MSIPAGDRMDQRDARERPFPWMAVVAAASAPLIVILCLTIWRTPFPVSEAVAIFEDVENRPFSGFLVPDTSYYRPLFYLAISGIWHGAGSIEARLAAVKLLHILPVVLLIVLLVWHLRPRTLLDAAAAAAAVAVLVGSPGFRDNLELPLSYTIAGMPMALAAWMLLEREPRPWHGPAVVALTLAAIGFKEQGLVLVPLVAAAWWTRAPGAGRGVAAAAAVIGVGYVALRLSWRASWPMFEQAVGLGFVELNPPDAEARFGAFPYLIYAYSGASTIANVLFAEPTRGVFRITHMLAEGRPLPWHLIHLGSSIGLTAVIGWWGIRSVRGAVGRGWTPEPRLFVALIVVLLASGLLSFNYSRDRLGGMAAVFYAAAAFFALRAAAMRTLETRGRLFAAAGLTLVLISAGWHVRATATVEHARATALRNRLEWLLQLPDRRLEFADRPAYLRIMHSMIEQGADPDAPAPTRYPPWLMLTIGHQ